MISKHSSTCCHMIMSNRPVRINFHQFVGRTCHWNSWSTCTVPPCKPCRLKTLLISADTPTLLECTCSGRNLPFKDIFVPIIPKIRGRNSKYDLPLPVIITPHTTRKIKIDPINRIHDHKLAPFWTWNKSLPYPCC